MKSIQLSKDSDENFPLTPPISTYPQVGTCPVIYYGHYSSLYPLLPSSCVPLLELAVFYSKLPMAPECLAEFKKLYNLPEFRPDIRTRTGLSTGVTEIQGFLGFIVTSLEHALALQDLQRDFKSAKKILDTAASKLAMRRNLYGALLSDGGIEHNEGVSAHLEEATAAVEKVVSMMRVVMEFNITCRLDNGLGVMTAVQEWLRGIDMENYKDVQVMCIYFYYRLGRLANGMYIMFDPARYGDIPVLPGNVSELELQPWQSIALLRVFMQTTGRFREAFSLLHSEENIEFTNTQARIDRYKSYLDDCYKYQGPQEVPQRGETAQGGWPIQQPVWYYILRAKLALVTEFCQAEDVEAAKQHLKESESILDSALAIFDSHYPELKVHKEALMLRALDARCRVLALSGCTPKSLFKAWISLADGAYKLRNIQHFLIGLETALKYVDFPKDSPNGFDGHLKLYRQLEKQYIANGNLLDLLCKLMVLSEIGLQVQRGLGHITEMVKDFHARFPEVQCWQVQVLIAQGIVLRFLRNMSYAAANFWVEMTRRYHDDEKEFWDKHYIPIPESLSNFPLDQVDKTLLPRNKGIFEMLVGLQSNSVWEVLFKCLKADFRAGVLTEVGVRSLVGQNETGSSLHPTSDSLRDHLLGSQVTTEKWFSWYQNVKQWLLKPTSWGPEHNRHILLARLLYIRAEASQKLHNTAGNNSPHEAELYGHQYIHYITEFLYNLYPELCSTARDTYSSICATLHENIGIMYLSLACRVRVDINCNAAGDYFAKAKLAYENARREHRRLAQVSEESIVLCKLALLFVLGKTHAIPTTLRPVSQAAAMKYLYEAQRLCDVYRSNVVRLEMGAYSLQLQQDTVNTELGINLSAHNTALSILMSANDDDWANPEQRVDCAGLLKYQNRNRETQIWEWVQMAKSRVLSEFSLMAPGNALLAATQGMVHQISAAKQAELDSLVRQDIDALQSLRQGKVTEQVKLRAIYDKVHKRLLEQLGRISETNCNPSTAQDTAAEPVLSSEALFSIQEAERLAIAAGGPVLLVQWFQYFVCNRFHTNDANMLYEGVSGLQLAMHTIRVSPRRDISSGSPELKTFKLKHHPCLVEDWIRDNMDFPVGDADGVKAKQRTLGLESSNERLRELDFLVAPLGEVSQRGDTLVFSPTRSLHRIPLHALQLPDGELVIKRNPVVYCQNLTILRKSYWINPLKSKRDQHQRRSAPNLASEASSAEPEENSCFTPFTAAIFNDSPRCSSLGRECLRVPCPRCSEIIQLGAKFKPPSHTYLAPDARKELFLQTLQNPPSVIHVNLHGVFPEELPNRTNPLLSEDKLENEKCASLNPDYFTGHLIQFPESELTAMDILEHAASYTRPSYKPFHVSLITCSSSRMQIDSTDNGIGLVGSFLYSGATSVLAALWNIQDEDGMMFAKNFYEDADGFVGVGCSGGATVVNLAKAAQRTVLAMVEGENGRLPPYHWAGFVLHGWWVYDADSDCCLQE